MGPRRTLLATLAGVVLIALVVVVALQAPARSGRGAGAQSRPAPALPREVLVGPRATLATLRGRPALINFWASWCAPCRREAAELRRFAADHGAEARLVGIDWGDNAGGARAFIRHYGWRFPVLRDTTNAVGNRFGLAGMPTTFVLDARGRITAELQGPQTVASLRRAVAATRG
jgi:thiol-disulfide isomerase/thioredoxin